MIQATEMAPPTRQTSDALHPLESAAQASQREVLPTADELRQTLKVMRENAQAVIALAQTLLSHKLA